MKKIFTLICVAILITTNFGYLFTQADWQTKQIKNGSKSDFSFENLTAKDYVPGEIIVKFKSTKINLKSPGGSNSVQTFADNKGMQIKQQIAENNIALLLWDKDQDITQKLSQLNSDSNIEYAQPNYIYHLLSTGFNDPLSGDLRALPKIQRYQAYGIFSGNVNTTGTLVAVIDAGVAYDHPDLQVNMRDGSTCKSHTGLQINGCLHGYDFADNDKNPYPVRSNHGTHVAGTIAAAANNGIGIIGVNPQSKIMAIRVGDDSMTTLAIVNGINFARHNGAKIINASFGGYTYDQTMYDAINDFKTAGGLFVAAAGNAAKNHAADGPAYPCGYDLNNIICVAATDSSDDLASFSDYGTGTVHLGAPGVGIMSTVITFSNNNMYTNNFNGSLGDMITGGNDFSRGVQNDMAMGGHDGFTSTYPTGVQDSYIQKTVNLTGYLGYNFTIRTYCDTPSGSDSDFLEINFMDGTNEVILIQTNEYYGPYVNQSSGINLITYTGGVSTVFYREEFKFDINAFQNRDFVIRARRYSDNILDQTNNLGCLIDYIKVEGISANELTYANKQGTSMAAPHVAGLASLARSASPSLNYSQLKNIILQNGDDLASLTGKTISGKRINALKVLQNMGYPYVQIYPAIGQILSGQGIQNNLDQVNNQNMTGFSGLYFASTSGAQELGRITFLTGLDLTDTGTQDFLQNDLPTSIGMEKGKIWFVPGTGFVGKNARLQMNMPLSFSDIGNKLNSGSFIVRSGSNWTGDMIDNDMITDVFVSTCDIFCPIYLDVAHFTSFELKPQLLQVNIQSNNSNTSYAKSGDVVTLTWTGSETLTGVSANINGLTGLVTGANISRYTTFQVTGGTSQTGIIFAINFSNLSGATGNTVTSTTNSSYVIVDSTPPILSGAASVGNTNTQNPTYSFTSNEVGTITYSGACSSTTTGAISGTNNITFNTLSNDTYNNCIIYVTDRASNQSSINVPSFTVNYTAPGGGGGGGGGGGTPPPPTCTGGQLVCSGGVYVLKTGQVCQGGSLGLACTVTGSNTGDDLSWLTALLNTGTVISRPQGNISGSPFSSELNQAYLYAYSIGITTMDTIFKANMTGTLQRSHLAKMIVNYADEILGLKPDTSKTCNFPDIGGQNAELRGYIRLSCQMGLMGVGISNFYPTAKVTRAEFGTILSRALRGNKYNQTTPNYYSRHLNELKKIGIMNKIDSPDEIEIRGWVMLMMMRADG